jgi:hypothetical protein
MIKVEGLKYIGIDGEKVFRDISYIDCEITELQYTRGRWKVGDFLPEEKRRFEKYINNKYPAYNFHPEESESLPYNSAWILRSCTPKTYRNWLCEYYEEMTNDLSADISILKDVLVKERKKDRAKHF